VGLGRIGWWIEDQIREDWIREDWLVVVGWWWLIGGGWLRIRLGKVGLGESRWNEYWKRVGGVVLF
ncbi:MAG: hypothetical protein ABEK59_03600, partial [Halobacteria archaeon]